MTDVIYNAPPTVSRFMRSDSFGRVISGPVGSSKTTGCIFEILKRCCEQAASPDGYRYTRVAIVRQTLKQLKDTVLRDIMSWLKDIAEFRVSENTIYLHFGDVRSEWLLLPLETPEDQRRLLSMQLTMAWMSESIEMPVELISPLAGRLGRYPSGNLGSPTFFGWVADTNMPAEGSDWHKLMVEPPPDIEVFIQPGGMEPDAENLEYLVQTDVTSKLDITDPEQLAIRRAQGRTYYERFLRSNSAEWCQRYVHAQFGDDPSGTAVFRTSFKRGIHVVEDLEPVPGRVIVIGQDFGRDPCSIITQLDHKGRLLVLEEIVAEDTGLENHINSALRPAVTDIRYLGKPVLIVGDPAGMNKSTLYEENEYDLLKRAGFAAMPAPGKNQIEGRIRAVEKFLLMQDGFLIDGTRCPTLVRALNGGYRFGRNKAGIRKPTPDKNEYSHIADALQYACLAADGGFVAKVAPRLMGSRPKPRRERFSSLAWT